MLELDRRLLDDLLGREVASLFDAPAEAGRLYRATWDAAGMPSGMYFVRLSSGGNAEMKRLMVEAAG